MRFCHSCTALRIPAALLAFLFLATIGFAPAPAAAQSISRIEQTDTNVRSYFYYVQPGTPTITSYVLGTVRNPGLYVVGRGTQLQELLALSGGPVLDERDRRTDRTVKVRLLRGDGPAQRTIFETEYRHGYQSAESFPEVTDGDVVEVEVISRRRFGLRTALTVVNTLALVALAVERFSTN